MTGNWRDLALIAGVLMGVGGLVLLVVGAGPVLLIFGVLIVITAVLERTYGAPSRRPLGPNWRATDERFVDPETGRLVTVWFDPATGERRYVAEGEAATPS